MVDLFYRIHDWLCDHIPHRCPCCGRWGFVKDYRIALHRLAGWVRLCGICYGELYGND